MAVDSTAAAHYFDLNYEFDAPQYYDFSRRDSNLSADMWFDSRTGTPEHRLPLADVGNVEGPIVSQHCEEKSQIEQTQATAENVPPPAQEQQMQDAPVQTAKKPNIVTSWGVTDTAKKAVQLSTQQPKPQATPRTARKGLDRADKATTGKKPAATSKTHFDGKPDAGSKSDLQSAVPGVAQVVRENPAQHTNAVPDMAAAPHQVCADAPLGAASRTTRSVFKKQIEEAALQHAQKKAQASRALHNKTVKAALQSVRRRQSEAGKQDNTKPTSDAAKHPNSKRAGDKDKKPTTASADVRARVRTAAAATTTKAAATAAASKESRKPTLRVVRGAVKKPAQGVRVKNPNTATVTTTARNNSVSAANNKDNSSKAGLAASRAAAATGKTRATGASRVHRSSGIKGSQVGAAWAGRLRSGSMVLQVDRKSGAGSKRPATAAPSSATERLRKVLKPSVVLPKYSTKPLTLPEEPNFATSKRARCEAHAPQDGAASASPYKPLVLKVQEFDTKTPARFKRQPLPVDPPKPLVITQPVEPHLATAARARPDDMRAGEAEEEEIMAAAQFHALPLRPEVLQGVTTCLSKPTAKPLTEPHPFAFITDDRAARRRARGAEPTTTATGVAKEEGQGAAFKARPLDPAVLEAPAHVPKKARMSLTVPVSPLLMTKTRASHAGHELRFQEEKMDFRARPVPSFITGPPRELQTIREAPQLTEPVPFQLRTELRGAAAQERLQTRLQQEAEAEADARRLKVAPVPPTVTAPAVPARPEPRPLTVPEPFQLQSGMRHEHFVQDFHSQVAQQQAQAKAEAEFKARPMWRGIPYQLHPSDAPLTVPDDVQLATEARAAERGEFDAAMADKIRAQEAEKAAAAEAAARREEELTKEYRRSLRFKAHPMPKYGRVFAPQPSNKPLTRPKSPQFGGRKRKAEDDGSI